MPASEPTPSLRSSRVWPGWEVVLVGTVLGAFAVAALGDHTGFFRCEQDYLAVGLEMASIEDALAQFHTQTGRYPTTSEGLSALSPLFPDGIPDDRWGHPFRYQAPSTPGEHYGLYSLGRDDQPGGIGQDADIDRAEFCDGRPRSWGS